MKEIIENILEEEKAARDKPEKESNPKAATPAKPAVPAKKEGGGS